MKRLFFIILAVSVSILASCTKVINLPLKKDVQRIVIEGFITKGETTHQVKITKTLDFDVSTPYPVVENANIKVEDNLGNTGVFTHIGNGIYEVTGFQGVEGRSYKLTVEHEGKYYVAESTMPREIILQDIAVIEIPFGGMSFTVAVPKWTDQAGETNYYHYQCYVNNELDEGIYLQDDSNQDGLTNEQPISVGIESGDELRIIMHNIDKKAYRYLYSIDANTGSIASPANPESNFGNGALGYFAARCTSEKTITVP